MRKKTKKQQRDKYLQQFLEGKTLIEISRDNQIPFKTVKFWHWNENWADELRKFQSKTREKVRKKVSEDEAQKLFNVRELLVEEYYDLNNLESKLSEEFRNGIKQTKLRALKQVADIDGLVKEKDTNINLKVTPILGNYNGATDDSNKKDNGVKKED